MDIWFYYHVTHALHDFMNPLSEEGFGELRKVLDPAPGHRMADIACGKGEMLVRFAESCPVSGVGVDISPYVIRSAGRNKAERAPAADLTFLEMKGQDYRPEEPFDVAMCVGASWIWDGYRGTLAALREMTSPGGLVLLGEPYWIGEPAAEYLAAVGLEREMFTSMADLPEVAGGADLSLVWMRGSSLQEWDRYQMLLCASVDRFAREEPDHPDLPEIRDRLAKDQRAYLRWGRDCMGFALWLFRRP